MPALDPADEDPMEHAPNAVDGTTLEAGPTPIDWHVSNEPNPFRRRLVVTVEGAPVLNLILDPLVVQDIVAALVRVHGDQRAALGLTPLTATASSYEPTTATVPSLPISREDSEGAGNMEGTEGTEGVAAAEDASSADTGEVPEQAGPSRSPVAAGGEEPPAEPAGPLSVMWWRQHKLLAFLLIFAAAFFVFGTISGTH